MRRCLDWTFKYQIESVRKPKAAFFILYLLVSSPQQSVCKLISLTRSLACSSERKAISNMPAKSCLSVREHVLHHMAHSWTNTVPVCFVAKYYHCSGDTMWLYPQLSPERLLDFGNGSSYYMNSVIRRTKSQLPCHAASGAANWVTICGALRAHE